MTTALTYGLHTRLLQLFTNHSSTPHTMTSRQSPTAIGVDSIAASTDHYKALTAATLSPLPADLLFEDSNPNFNTSTFDK